MEKLNEEKSSSKSPMLDKSNDKDKQKDNQKSKSKSQSKDPFYRRLFGRLTNKKERENVRQNLGKLMEEPLYKFRRYPWDLWSTSLFILTFCIIITYCLTVRHSKTAFYYFVDVMLIIFYILSFVALYISEVEIFTIDRKKLYVKLGQVNIFCSKKERYEYFNAVEHFQIVMTGTKKGPDDNRKYFIRVNFRDKTIKPMEWGHTWSFDAIAYKYQVCLAMVKGLVVEKVEKYLIKDESFYPEYMH